MDTIHGTFRRDGLVRPVDGRVLGGVCAGLGRRFGLDPWPARLLFALLLLLVPGTQLLLYPVLWILLPSESQPAGAGALQTPTMPAPGMQPAPVQVRPYSPAAPTPPAPTA